MNISNCNFCYPKLTVSPSYGDAIRYHADFREGHPEINDLESYPISLQRYIKQGTMVAVVDWGPADSSHRKMLSDFIVKACTVDSQTLENPIAELTVHSIGCRPAMALLASVASEICVDLTDCSFSEMCISWRDLHSIDKSVGNIEYLVKLNIVHSNTKRIILTRTLHAARPPIGPLKFRLQDIVWAPQLFKNNEVDSADAIRAAFHTHFHNTKPAEDTTEMISQRRRGFGLELETVRMPLAESDFESGCFSQQQEFTASVERARRWHLNNISLYENEEHSTTIDHINEMWDKLLLWSVSHDLYVENAAPPSRLDLYSRIRAHLVDKEIRSDLAHPENEDFTRALDYLVLGGKPMPAELLPLTPYDEVPVSQASPEYKSPLPPNELFHEFPAREDGNDLADASIRLFLEGILKNPSVATKPVVVPLVSDLGQSATSIHVHVNIANPTAWPRLEFDQVSNMERTQSLLCVVFAWVVFDRVVQNNFCMPNVWRDRSFAPMLPSGPEFVWKELSWEQGSSIPSLNDDGFATDVNTYNFPAWFRHVHMSYTIVSSKCQVEEKESTSLFQTVFDHDVMSNTISRWNSLNLLPINSYGTIEFRRMHATLDANFVSAWTWFCVGFVEKLCSCDMTMRQKYLLPFVEENISWEQGLERLAEAQNNATIEDLIEIMSNDNDQVLPANTIHVLMGNCCSEY